jgi:hypothetical protein
MDRQSITLIATAISNAWRESSLELEAELTNKSIVQYPEVAARRRTNLENTFFNVVTAYRELLDHHDYVQLCNKVSITIGHNFIYRP